MKLRWRPNELWHEWRRSHVPEWKDRPADFWYWSYIFAWRYKTNPHTVLRTYLYGYNPRLWLRYWWRTR